MGLLSRTVADLLSGTVADCDVVDYDQQTV